MVALPSCGLVKTLLALGLCCVAWAVGAAYGSEDVFTNSFVVEMNEGAGHNIHSIAKRHDFEYLGTVLGNENLHHFVHKRSPSHRRRRSTEPLATLEAEPMVKRVIQQKGFKRDKRGFKDLSEIFKRQKRDVAEEDATNDEAKWTEFNDPLIPKQWFLNNTGQANGKKGLDLNVEAAWKKGYTGKGVTIAIMDDGEYPS